MAFKSPAENLILIPKDVIPMVKNASCEELKTLIYFFSEPAANINDAARTIGITVAQIESAIAFWRGAGIFEDSLGEKKKIANDTSSYRNYDSETLYKAIETNKDFKMIRDLAMVRLQKPTLTKNDLSSLFYLFDFAGMPPEIICGVIEYCAEIGKRNVEYVYKKATALYEDGITTYDKFEAYIEKSKRINDNIFKLRTLLGIGDRKLSTKEKKMFDCWFGDWNLPFEMVEFAYDKMIDAKGKIAIPYLNGILSRWHESGYQTAEEAENGDNATRNSNPNSSFEGDEFIEAALNRGFDD